MKGQNYFLRLAIAMALFVTAVRAADISRPQNAAVARGALQHALKAGTRVVLVVATDKPPNADDEAYGDWADNLKSFANSVPPGVKLIRLTPVLYARVVGSPKVKEEFATVFVRDPAHAVVYDGAIVESRVYKLALEFLSAGPVLKDLEEFILVHQKEFEGEGLKQEPIRLVLR